MAAPCCPLAQVGGGGLHGSRVISSRTQLHALLHTSPWLLPLISVHSTGCSQLPPAASFFLLYDGLWQGASRLYTGARHLLILLPGGCPPRLQYGNKGVELGLEPGQRLGVVVVAINFTVPATPGGRHNTHTNRVKHLAAGEVRRTNITSSTVSSAQHNSIGERHVPSCCTVASGCRHIHTLRHAASMIGGSSQWGSPSCTHAWRGMACATELPRTSCTSRPSPRPATMRIRTAGRASWARRCPCPWGRCAESRPSHPCRLGRKVGNECKIGFSLAMIQSGATG